MHSCQALSFNLMGLMVTWGRDCLASSILDWRFTIASALGSERSAENEQRLNGVSGNITRGARDL
jgi:hypothetical protein